MFHSKQDVDNHVSQVFRNIKSENQRNLKCYQIAKLYYKFKDYKSAIKYLNRYILSTSNSAAAHRLLGECYLGVNLKVKALDSFKNSLELNGNQHDLVLKVCTLLMDPEVSAVTPRATYWLERAESLFPTNPVVFQLREHLLKSNSEGRQDNGQLEKLILSEISARPADVTVRIRLLNFFVDTKRYKIAYQHALEIEDRNTFSNDLRWYDCLCNLVQAYEKANNDLGFTFFVKKILFFERRADLFMQEFQDEVKTLPECSSALFAFDQSLHAVSKIEVPPEDSYFFAEFLKHMRAQLAFHLATLALKRAKKEYGIWQKAFRTASPLLLQASQNSMDLEDAWYNMWSGRNKFEREVRQWNKSAAFRISQAGHVLLAWSQSKGPKFLDKVSQFCGGKWQSNVYQDIFYSREHQQAMSTSHFINDSFFSNVPMRLLSESELNHFDEVSQYAYPDSLHHIVWLGLAYCNANGQLNHDFRCATLPDLQFTVENLSQSGPETLNQLDVDAFLYASVLCAKSNTPNIIGSDRPSRLPVSVSEELCSAAQSDWWVAVYKTYKNQNTGSIADMRLKLRRGIETIRVFGQHGLHVKLIVMLAKLFQERAAKNKNPNELNGLEDRAYLYWTAAIPLLEKMEKNQVLREIPNRLFDYRGKDLTPNEIKGHLEDGRLFLACRLMKQGRHEQAIEAFQSLKSPYATFYQALIYEKLASEELNHRRESITSENRSQHIILLSRARDAFYLTLDRLRCPSVDPNHPLNAQLQDHLEEIEKQLAMIDPDSNLNRNGDAESDETDTAAGPLSPDVEDNMDISFNVYNPGNFLSIKNSTGRPTRHNYSSKNARFEARPSPERLDAQLRHLIQANSNGLQAIVEQLKDMKSIMQIELKDLGCITRDLLAEMKRWNDRLESVSKKATESSIKPGELFELTEDDYEDIYMLSQQHRDQNYQINRQMTGTQGTSTVTYGTPVPSPVPNVIPPHDNPLIPTSFYPGAHPVPPIDPSLLLFQTLGYYAQGMPYPGDNQNVPDYRGTGIQKGSPFQKNAYKAPEPGPALNVLTTKPQPPNVIITSSDTLPAFTSAATPAMSVTIPPQHIRGLTPSVTAQKPNSTQVHPFQIPMPPTEHLVKENPTEKLNAMIPVSSLSSTPIQTAIVSGVKPTIMQQTTPPKGILQTNVIAPPILKIPEQSITIKPKTDPEIKTAEEKGIKLFEGRGKLLVLEDKEWKERGIVLTKILNDEKFGKVRLLMTQEPILKVYADHYITPDMLLEQMKNNDKGWIWAASNLQKSDLKEIWQSYCLLFNTVDEARDFAYAFNEGRKASKGYVKSITPKATPSKELIEKKQKECSTCKMKLEGNSEKCAACENKNKSNEKSNLGGFTFMSSPIVKPPVLKLNEQKEKPKETSKPSPFAEFSFPVTSTTSSGDSNQKTTGGLFNTANLNVSNADNLFGVLSLMKPDPNSFKKDANFKGFEGENSLVFGNLKPKTPASKPEKQQSANKSTTNDEEDDDGNDDFEPNVEFTPVVDLPDLVDVKTGEENDIVLFDERAKLLRFDTNGKEWKERGVGHMKVLHNEESGKVRLIMRREILLKVCCNHYLHENMEFKPLLKSEKALTWYAQDYSEEELKTELLALRFANTDSMSRFLKVIKDTQSKMQDGRMKGTEVKEPVDKPKDLKPLSEMFKPKAGSWECGTCLIRNNEGTTKCVSCETPKPGTEGEKKEPVTQMSGLGKGITFPPTTTKFTFGIPPPTTSTPAPAAPNPDAKFTFGIPQATSTPSTTPSSFTFGIPSSNSNAPSFGVPPSSTAPSFGVTPSSTAPSFGISSSSTAPSFGVTPSSTAPSFGVTPSSTAPSFGVTPSSTAPSFGISSSSTAPSFGVTLSSTAPAPVFGITPSSKTTASSVFGSSPATKFTFGSPSVTPATSAVSLSTNKFTFGMPRTTSTTSLPAPNFSFGTNTTASSPATTTIVTPNVGAKSFGPTVTTAPLTSSKFTFTPSKAEGSNIFGGISLKKENEPTSFTFNIPKTDEQSKPKNEKSTTGQSTFSFATGLKPEGKEKFEFSLSQLKPPTKPGQPKSSSPHDKSLEGADSKESDDETVEDNGDHIIVKPIVPLPDKVAPHTGEEDENVMYEQRAKLYRFTNKEWKERGIGDVKILKHKENNKIRLLMRREILLKLCLNHYLTPEIEFTPKDEKTWQWSAADFSEGEVSYDMFAIRFKTPDIAKEFKKAIDDVKNNVTPTFSKPEVKAKEPTPAMKSFVFAVPNAPKSTESPKGSQATPSDDDISVVYQKDVTPEEREKAKSLHLPPNFYSYLREPDCPGCPGCDKDDAPSATQQNAPADSTTPSHQELYHFGNTSWGTLNFGKDDDIKGQSLFAFAGNQAATKRKPIPDTSSLAKEEEDDENDDEEGDEGNSDEYEVVEEEEDYDDEDKDEKNEEKDDEDDDDDDDDDDEDDEEEEEGEDLG